MGSLLVVEPDPAIRERWTGALRAAGHAVLTATGSRQAAAMLRDGGIDVVVIDGYDACADVVELARDAEALPDAPPLVLVSGSPAAPEISARIGAAAFLPKPCEPAEIVAIVTRLVGELRPVRVVDDEPTGRTQVG